MTLETITPRSTRGDPTPLLTFAATNSRAYFNKAAVTKFGITTAHRYISVQIDREKLTITLTIRTVEPTDGAFVLSIDGGGVRSFSGTHLQTGYRVARGKYAVEQLRPPNGDGSEIVLGLSYTEKTKEAV